MGAWRKDVPGGRPLSATTADDGTTHRPPPWRDVRVLRVFLQVAFLVAVVALLWWLFNNLVTNLRARGIRTDFGFLTRSAGFTLAGTDFRSVQPIWQALIAGLRNTITVSAVGIILATALGTVVGIARLSKNWLVRRSASAFVEAFRNIPLLVLLFFLYGAVLRPLPSPADAIEVPGVVLSNRGLWVPWIESETGAGLFWLVLLLALLPAGAVWIWRTRRSDATGEPHRRSLWSLAVLVVLAMVAWLVLDGPVGGSIPLRDGRIVDGGYRLTPEHAALLIGLVVYTAAFIAEIVRGSILAVPTGQTEAAEAVGLSATQRLRYVILPQAMRVAVPPTGNEFLNLTKNSSLGIAIAFPELLRVTRIAIGQGMPAPQLIGIMMFIYLVLSLFLALISNLINRSLQVEER